MMSSEAPVEQRAKSKLVSLVKAIDKVVESQMQQFETDEINYVLQNYSQHLKYDLNRDFEKNRTKNLKESPFDDLFNN